MITAPFSNLKSNGGARVELFPTDAKTNTHIEVTNLQVLLAAVQLLVCHIMLSLSHTSGSMAKVRKSLVRSGIGSQLGPSLVVSFLHE